MSHRQASDSVVGNFAGEAVQTVRTGGELEVDEACLAVDV
jgi:hypothetical protein